MLQFDQYISQLTAQNKLAKANKFVFTTCSGESQLQGAIQNLRTASAYIIADTVTSGGTIKKGASFYQRRTYTFFIIKKSKYGYEQEREKSMDVCRELRKQFLSKILYDMSAFTAKGDADISFETTKVSFDLTSVQSVEYPDMRLDNCTGLFVMINSDEPINLAYAPGEWDS